MSRHGDPPAGGRGRTFAPVFVVGFPRSGTTLVQRILDRHPDIAIAPETHAITRVWARRDRIGDLSNDWEWTRLLSRIAADPGFRAAGVDAYAVRRRDRGGPRTVDRGLRLVLEAYADARGASIPGEKTPVHQLHMLRLQEWYPRARFLQVVRDPRAAVSSWRAVPWSSGSILTDALEWRLRHDQALEDAERVSRLLTIRYEDLVGDPERTVRRVCAFLQVPYSPAMLEGDRGAPPGIDTRREPWKAGADGPVTPDRVEAWRTELSRPQVLVIEALCAPLIRRFRYAPTTPAPLRAVAAPLLGLVGRPGRRLQRVARRLMPGRTDAAQPRVVLSEAVQSEANPYGKLLAGALETADPSMFVEPFRPRAVLDRRAPSLWHMHWPESVPGAGPPWTSLIGTLAWLGAALVCRLRRVPMVWTVHNVHPHDRRRSWLTTRFMGWIVGRLDGWIALSEPGARDAVAAYPGLRRKPRLVVPHGHYAEWYGPLPDRDGARAELGVAPDQVVLLALGRVRSYKRIPDLLRAFRATEGDGIRMIVAGRPETADLEARLRDLGRADDRVRLLLDRVPEAALTGLLAAADGFVLPAERMTNSGSALLALSYGVPVLVPDTAVMRELRDVAGPDAVSLFGGGIDASTLAAFAAAVARGYAGLRERTAERVRAAHDWAVIGARTAGFFSRLIEHTRKPPARPSTPGSAEGGGDGP